ncbi:MAG: 2-oxo acid dehydrogenase subunit E2 [Bdellovibrionaceae bacterium]|nr:2-oxo acid dehydrogenase subunit E2 [Pseudobdellovibrionaceae bacterium]NUM60281.1 2-oxo acid dehydrogenase subunit E2 [Pseudobdellovibrionaceae bacterium]
MKEYKILPYSRMFDLYDILNKENKANCKAVAVREIETTNLDQMRVKLSEGQMKPTYTSFIARATAMVLKEMPNANRATIETFFLRRTYRFLKTHVSVAVERNDSEGNNGGAFVYTIYNTDEKKLIEITKEISGLADSTLESNDPRLERWRRIVTGAKRVPFSWILSLVIWCHKNIPYLYIRNRGGAVMISSPSKYGVDFIVAHWPYTIGLSFGLVKERAWVVSGELAVRKTMPITLAFDRRIVSGADAARFMNRLCEILENPGKFLKE